MINTPVLNADYPLRVLRVSSSKSSGFSMIEIFVVLAIVAIISVIAIGSQSLFTGKSKVSQIQSFLSEIGTKQGDFYLNNRQYANNLNDLKMTMPPALSNFVRAFRLSIGRNDKGQVSFQAVVVPNNSVQGLEKVYPLVINKDVGYYSLNALCQAVRNGSSNDKSFNDCKMASGDKLWTEGAAKPTIAELIQKISSGTVTPPVSMKGVDSVCAYAIGIKDLSLFDSQNCSQSYAWPYKDENTEISDACLDAFNSNNRTAFNVNSCCSQVQWISKASAQCTAGGGVQPTSPASLSSLESAGQLKMGTGNLCITPASASAGAAIKLQICQVGNANQNWYIDSNGLLHNAADPNLCFQGLYSGGCGSTNSTLQTCNTGSTMQKITWDGKTAMKFGNGQCMDACGGGAGVQGQSLISYACRDGAVNQNVGAADPAALFASNPACGPAINSNDYTSFRSSGCCALGDWTGPGISCKSIPFSLPTSAANALQIQSNGGCLMLRLDGAVAQHDCIGLSGTTVTPPTTWFTGSDGLIHLGNDPTQCLVAPNAGNTINSSTLRVTACNASDPNQKFTQVGGQLRRESDGRCLTTQSYVARGNAWVGAVDCSGTYTPNFTVGSVPKTVAAANSPITPSNTFSTSPPPATTSTNDLKATNRIDSSTGIKYVAIQAPNGALGCASYDGRNCLGNVTAENIDSSKLVPVYCGTMFTTVYGHDGYSSPYHWCAQFKKAFVTP